VGLIEFDCLFGTITALIEQPCHSLLSPIVPAFLAAPSGIPVELHGGDQNEWDPMELDAKNDQFHPSLLYNAQI